MESGTVVSLRLDKGYFFVRPDGGGDDVFAHCKELVGLEFDDRLEQRRVKYDQYKTDRGFKASNVQPAI